LDKVNKAEHSIRELKEDLRVAMGTNEITPLDEYMVGEADNSSADSGIRELLTNSQLSGEKVHLGANSVPAMVIALGNGSNDEVIQDLIGQSVLPVFGLDNESASYPFVDLWGLPAASPERVQELCKLLPSNPDCLQYFRQYRDTAHVLFPGAIDIQQFEVELTQFLTRRIKENTSTGNGPLTGKDVYGKSLHWLGLLFAILASGTQCSGMPRKQRQLTAQVYSGLRLLCFCLMLVYG
jgi:hypothetical protein